MKFKKGDLFIDDIYYETTAITDVCGLFPYEYYEFSNGIRIQAGLLEYSHTFITSIFWEAFDDS